jgi:DNA polymerase IV
MSKSMSDHYLCIEMLARCLAFSSPRASYFRTSLRGKSIAVGGGVVLAASYEAKAFGVRGGMSDGGGRELCPRLRSVNGTFKVSNARRCSDEGVG